MLLEVVVALADTALRLVAPAVQMAVHYSNIHEVEVAAAEGDTYVVAGNIVVGSMVVADTLVVTDSDYLDGFVLLKATACRHDLDGEGSPFGRLRFE